MRLRVGRSGAGVDLQFLLAQRRERGRRILVERALNRHAVELVSELGVVTAADVDRLVDAVLSLRDEHAGNRRDRRVGLIDRAAAAKALNGGLLRRRDRVDVGRRTGFHERRRGACGDTADRLKGRTRGNRDAAMLVGENVDAGERGRFESGLLTDSVYVSGASETKVKCPPCVRGRRRRLRRTRDGHFRAGDRCSGVGLRHSPAKAARRARQNPRSLDDHRDER